MYLQFRRQGCSSYSVTEIKPVLHFVSFIANLQNQSESVRISPELVAVGVLQSISNTFADWKRN